MKKFINLLLCVTLIFSALVIAPAHADSYELKSFLSNNFNTYTGASLPSYFQWAKNSVTNDGNISGSKYERASDDGAVLVATSGGSITTGNAPAFQWAITSASAKGYSAKGITLSADVLIDEFTANDTGKLFGIAVRGSGGWYWGSGSAGVFNSDRSVAGGENFAVDTWYNIAITFDYVNHLGDVVLTNLSDNTKTVLADDIEIKEWANDITVVNFEVYCPSKIAIDNPSISEAGVAAIYSPESGSSADVGSVTASVCFPEDIASAALYLDGEKVQDITKVSGQLFYEVSCPVSTLGNHKLSLISKALNGNTYANAVDVNVTTMIAEKIKNIAFWQTTAELNSTLGGGIGGFTKYTTTKGTTDSTDWRSFTYSSKDTGNNPLFMRCDPTDDEGTFRISVRAKAGQTNEKFRLQVEKPDGSTNLWVDVLGDDGLICGTTEPYNKDTWYDIYLDFDTVTGAWKLYVGGDYISGGTYATPNTKFKAFSVYMYGNNNDNASFTFDNLRLDKLYPAPQVEKIVSVTDNAENDIIITDADSVRLYFNCALNSESVTLSNVTAAVNGEPIEISDVKYTAVDDGGYVDIDFTYELPRCSELIITFSENLANEIGAIGYPYVVSVETGVASVTQYGELALSSTGSTVSAAIDVYCAEVGGSEAVLIIAGYKDNETVDVKVKECTLSYGKNVISSSIENTTGTSFKAFLVNNMDDVIPLVANAEE